MLVPIYWRCQRVGVEVNPSVMAKIAQEVHDISIKGLVGDDATLLRYVHDEVKPLKNHKILLVFDVSLSVGKPRS